MDRGIFLYVRSLLSPTVSLATPLPTHTHTPFSRWDKRKERRKQGAVVSWVFFEQSIEVHPSLPLFLFTFMLVSSLFSGKKKKKEKLRHALAPLTLFFFYSLFLLKAVVEKKESAFRTLFPKIGKS